MQEIRYTYPSGSEQAKQIENDLKFAKKMFFAYLEGWTQARQMMMDEKLPRHQYRGTRFIGWFEKYYPGYTTPIEKEFNEWLDEYLNMK